MRQFGAPKATGGHFVANEIADVAQRSALRSSFYFAMTLTMAAIVFFGFGLSYFAPLANGEAGSVPPVTHLHGAFFFAWIVLLVVQSALVRRGRVALHRSLGLLGIAIGTASMVLALVLTALYARAEIGSADVVPLTYVSCVAIVGFGILFALALRNLRNPGAHRRYILLATAAFLIAGLNRIYFALWDLPFVTTWDYVPRYLTIDVLIAAMLVHDWRALGRPHAATMIGGAVNVVPQLAHAPVVGSAGFVRFTHWLASLAYFRPDA